MIVGKHTYGQGLIQINWGAPHHTTELTIGSFCSIARCTVYLGGNHRTDWISTFPIWHFLPTDVISGHPSSNGNVVIGNDVWIADHVTIMSGVTIGDGAVVACNSHVVKDVEPYALVGGNPAKLIKLRFAREQIFELLQIKWWNWSDEKIAENVHLLCSPNIEEFIAKHRVPEGN